MKFFTHADRAINMNFTSLQGHIQGTLAEMQKAFGTPCPMNGERSNFHWTIEFADGTVATIYDWNLRAAPQLDEIVSWNIGGHSEQARTTVHQAFRAAHHLKAA